MKKATFAVILIAFIGLIALVITLSLKKTKDDSNENNPINKNLTIAPVDSSDVIEGNVDAPITLIEYSDFQCPYCISLYPILKKAVNETYNNQVRWVFRSYPLPFHQAAKPAALAALAANEQGKFPAYADKLAQNSKSDGSGLSENDLTQYAKDLGLDLDKFKQDMASTKLTGKLDQDIKSGNDAGLEGTPTVYILNKDGQLADTFSGILTMDQLKAKIDPLTNIK